SLDPHALASWRSWALARARKPVVAVHESRSPSAGSFARWVVADASPDEKRTAMQRAARPPVLSADEQSPPRQMDPGAASWPSWGAGAGSNRRPSAFQADAHTD